MRYDTERVVVRFFGLVGAAAVLGGNYVFWKWLFTLGSAKFLGMLATWLLLGSWTSAIAFVLCLYMLFGD
jgi:hypothetical protein